MTIKYTDEQISNLLKEVEVSFGQLLQKSEEAPVEKEDEDSEEDKKEDDQEAQDKSPEESKEDEDSEEDKEDNKEAEDKSPESQEQDFDYDDEDLDELHKMYSSMGPKEKDAHHNALKKALGLEDKSVEQPVEMQKSEELAKKDEEVTLAKAEITSLQAKNAELQKNLDAVAKFLETLNKSVPQRKSVTSIDYIQKSEESKEIGSEQVDVILQKKVRDSSLSKSDRDAINTYYLNGKSIETIKHLLK